MRKTKIVCTLGPATQTYEKMTELVNAGLNVARINFSHGTHESHLEVINTLKKVREELNKPIPLVLDTKGPEIRTKKLKNDTVNLEEGKSIILTTDDIEGDEKKVAVTYKNLPNDIKVGTTILVDDGLIELLVKEINGNEIVCKIINSGTLGNNKGINIPNVYVNLPALTEKDINDIKFGIKQGFDYIAASFIRSGDDVNLIKRVLSDNDGNHIQIISKIENRDGVNNIDEILKVTDGIMVARGDLGVEIPPEEVPLVQKMLIEKANKAGKIVITATQMLESMIVNPRPTRAEANDVANSILDGTDAIMLSGETAKGDYPVESVKMMDRIAKNVEKSIDFKNILSKHTPDEYITVTNAICYAACTTAFDLNSACIVSITDSGFSTKMVSRFRPNCHILGITDKEDVYRKLNLIWGVKPILSDPFEQGKERSVFQKAFKLVEESNMALAGDSVVVVAGVPVGLAPTTNTLKVQILGNILAKGKSIGTKGTASGVTRILETGKDTIEFNKGDVLVTNTTDDSMIDYIRLASAVIVGDGGTDKDFTHIKTLSKALNTKVILCQEKVESMVPNGIFVSIDTKKGFIYNGNTKK